MTEQEHGTSAPVAERRTCVSRIVQVIGPDRCPIATEPAKDPVVGLESALLLAHRLRPLTVPSITVNAAKQPNSRIVRSVRKRIRIVVALVICLLVLASCGFGPGSRGLPDRPGETGGLPPKGILTLQPPFLPIVISIDTDGKFALIASPVMLVSLIGTVTFGVGVFKDLTGRPLPDPRLRAVTQLVICQKDRVEKPCQAYEIGSARKMHIEMKGSFVQDVEQNRIRIDASPGSTIHCDGQRAGYEAGIPVH